MKAKYIVAPLVILGAGYLYYTEKLSHWKSQITKLKALPTGIRNLKIEGGFFKCNIDISLKNPTTENFNPNGVIAILKKINIIKDGAIIASVTVNKSSLNIPANGEYTLKNLLVEIPLAKSFLTVAQQVLRFKNLKLKDIQTQTIIDILGKEYIV